jgi:hypothetical protein
MSTVKFDSNKGKFGIIEIVVMLVARITGSPVRQGEHRLHEKEHPTDLLASANKATLNN